MKRRLSVLALAAAMGWLCGCNRAPSAIPVDRLSFPVVLVVGTSAASPIASRAEVVASDADLHRMRVETYSTMTDTSVSDPPIVIDSNAMVLDMKDIKGEHGGLWMMANPTGMMPIQFTLLQHRESGIEAARSIIANCQFLGGDLDEARKKLRGQRIRQARTMTEVMRIIDEMPSADASDNGT